MAHSSSESLPALEVKGVGIKRGNAKILQNVSFVLKEGEIAAVLGPSGCGKTSLMRALAGLEEPHCGQIDFRGEKTAQALAEARVGFVPQSSILLPWLTARENAELLRQCRALSGAKGDLDQLADLMGLKDEMLARRAPTLSGGEQQRIALMRALLLPPELLILDESFSSIDLKIKRKIIGRLRNLLKDPEETTIVATVLVSHDIADCLLFADTIYLHNDQEKSFERIHSVKLGSDRVNLSLQDDCFIRELRVLDSKLVARQASDGSPR